MDFGIAAYVHFYALSASIYFLTTFIQQAQNAINSSEGEETRTFSINSNSRNKLDSEKDGELYKLTKLRRRFPKSGAARRLSTDFGFEIGKEKRLSFRYDFEERQLLRQIQPAEAHVKERRIQNYVRDEKGASYALSYNSYRVECPRKSNL